MDTDIPRIPDRADVRGEEQQDDDLRSEASVSTNAAERTSPRSGIVKAWACVIETSSAKLIAVRMGGSQ